MGKEKELSIVYSITNPDVLQYIGVTTDLTDRIYHHKSDAARYRHDLVDGRTHISQSIYDHGWDAHELKVEKVFDGVLISDVGQARKKYPSAEANEYETSLIRLRNTIWPNGLNSNKKEKDLQQLDIFRYGNNYRTGEDHHFYKKKRPDHSEWMKQNSPMYGLTAEQLAIKSEKITEEMVALREFYTVRQIAERYGVSTSAVHYRLRKYRERKNA